MKDDFAKALVDAPGHLLRFVGGLIIALLSDYSLITLLIFVTLLGLVVESVLIAATAFFGLYFLVRLVVNIADVIAYHAKTVGSSNMQIAAVLAQFRTDAQSTEEPTA